MLHGAVPYHPESTKPERQIRWQAGRNDPATVAEAILHEISRDGFSIGEHQIVDRVTGEIGHHVDATDAKTGETWTVNAPTAYEAAAERGDASSGG